ncbi:MAG: methyltransferase domain-containing protein [Alphaproteobacteria bacterium]|nr:methyltransferase domain-containing protein [Alphaproteobacteria bacterium]
MHTEELARDPLGVAAELIAAGRADEVVAAARQMLAAQRGGVLTRVALGRALVAAGDSAEAVASLREADLLSPNTPEVVLAFGEALAAAGALPTAIAEFQRAVRLSPHDGRPHWQIAQLWLAAGEPDKAEATADTALALHGASDGAVAELRVAAARIRTASRADAGYVRHLFDQFAADYDTRMRGRLGYAAPGILRDLVGLLIDPDARFDVLDLGCGTGLSGLAFKPIAKSLVGVDLSPKMLAKARELNIYDKLIGGDVETLNLARTFDIVVAADVLVYLGDLTKLFAVARARLTPNGLWLFTTEKGDAQDFGLGKTRRYRHSEAYLRRLAETHGFDAVSLIECVTRYEAGVAVPSWAAALRLRH